MKIVEILDGPFSEGGLVWMRCILTDGRGDYWAEDIYYETLCEAYEDLDDVTELGAEIELDADDYLEEEGNDYE